MIVENDIYRYTVYFVRFANGQVYGTAFVYIYRMYIWINRKFPVSYGDTCCLVSLLRDDGILSIYYCICG